jgi:hypothetical protein
VARVVASHAAHDRALHAARGVSAAGCRQAESSGSNEKTHSVIQFHSDSLLKNSINAVLIHCKHDIDSFNRGSVQ